jgi:hypothetical protein
MLAHAHELQDMTFFDNATNSTGEIMSRFSMDTLLLKGLYFLHRACIIGIIKVITTWKLWL